MKANRLHVEYVLPAKVESEQLWHYTSAVGALGILQSRSLQLGSVRMMNDKGELDFGLAKIEEHIGRFERRSSGLFDTLQRILNLSRTRRIQTLYIGCASTARDSLSQIRGYGEYMLGINSAIALQLHRPAQSEVPGLRDEADWKGTTVSTWRPVIYGHEEAAAHIDKVLDIIVTNRQELLASNEECQGFSTDMAETEFLMRSAAAIVACAAFLKHPAFQDEKEVRVLANVPVKSNAVSLRAGRFGIAPFVTVHAETREPRSVGEELSFLNAVRLGPGSSDPEAAFFGLEQAMEHLHYLLIHPEQVLIPFRG